ncbi:hypothetical protein CDCA_CDCA02G0487 [Cyanidium caldarium]|uniref:Uncharacterized protein n=1 Tax=Cyanidium caldarium TaxID=2771 RepID=A0AAV9IQ27_CYACA|nr:hypothetical protein CDCA_CDCA02G0487 [Cyanidium caldarium]
MPTVAHVAAGGPLQLSGVGSRQTVAAGAASAAHQRGGIFGELFGVRCRTSLLRMVKLPRPPSHSYRHRLQKAPATPPPSCGRCWHRGVGTAVPNADHDTVLLKAFRGGLVAVEDLLVEPLQQLPSVRALQEGETLTTASLQQLLRDHHIESENGMDYDRLAKLAVREGIAMRRQLQNRKPQPERRRDPTHLERLLDEVAQQLAAQGIRETGEREKMEEGPPQQQQQ